MKMLIVMAIGLLLGTALVWAAEFEPGFVLLQYGSWSFETSLVVFIVALVVLIVVAYMVLRSFVLFKQTPQRLSVWNLVQRHKRANQALTKGLIILEEGRWTEAERLLVKHANNSETPLLHYLAAARAAQKQGASDRRDNYLSLAHQATEGSDIVVGVVQAQLQLDAEQKEQALATLQHLREISPKHPYVLQLLQALYQEMGQWQDVQAVLPDLRKRYVLSNADVKALSSDTTVKQMQTAVDKQDWQQVYILWQQSANKDRQSEMLLSIYVDGLIKQGKTEQAISLMEKFLAKSWSDNLVYKYGLIEQGDILKRLAKAEAWLKKHQDNPWLLLSLGRLAKTNQFWAKAEDYLRDSLEHGARGETYQLLAEILVVQGKSEQAMDLYKQGLSLMLSASVETP